VSKGRDDKKFLSALHYFVVHNIAWRALPAEFGNWNSIWKRFWRLSQSDVFEAFFEALAAMSAWFKCSTPRSCAPTSRLPAQKGAGPVRLALSPQDDQLMLKSMGLICFCIRM
jgi:transposase